MTTSRGPMTQLTAIAAMPGLDEMAIAIAEQTGVKEENVLRHLLFAAGQWAYGSRAALTDELTHDFVWDHLRQTARQVGRELSKRRPTHDTLRHLRDDCPDLSAVAAAAFTPAMSSLVRAAGLLLPTPPRVYSPDRANTIIGDGTVFKPATDLVVDPVTGLVEGSRSKKNNPRCAERFYGKPGTSSQGVSGMPVCVIGVRDDEQWQRGVLAVGIYEDRDECAEAMRLFHQTVAVYGDGVHGFAYDRLMNGKRQQEIMRAGVVPLVGMPGVAATAPGLDVPDALQDALGTYSQPKFRAMCQRYGDVEFQMGDSTCHHQLFALDGVLVAIGDGELAPTWSSSPCPQVSLRFVDDGHGQQRLIGTYRVPCRHHHPPIEIDHSGDRMGADRKPKALADWLRPIEFERRSIGQSFRQDIESTFSTAKRLMALDGRASSYRLNEFLFDVVGFGLWVNATLWDVHVAQLTLNAKKVHRAQQLARLKKAHLPG